MKIPVMSRYRPRYLSRRDIAIFGEILQHDITIVEKAGDRKDALEKESDGNGDVVCLFLLSFFTLRFLSSPQEEKKGGAMDSLLPLFSFCCLSVLVIVLRKVERVLCFYF